MQRLLRKTVPPRTVGLEPKPPVPGRGVGRTSGSLALSIALLWMAGGEAEALRPPPLPAVEPIATPSGPPRIAPQLTREIAEMPPRPIGPAAQASADPEELAALTRAAHWLARAGDWQGAIDAREQRLAREPRSASVEDLDQLARLRLVVGDAEGAESDWRRAAAIAAEEDPRPWLALARFYAARGQNDLASQALEEAQVRDASNPEVLFGTFALALPTGSRSVDPVSTAPVAAAPIASPWERLTDWSAERLGEIEAGLPPSLGSAVERVGQWLSNASTTQLAILGLAALALVALPPRFLRQRGDLAVALRYPEELRGTFRLRVARKRRNLRDRADGAGSQRAEILKGGTSSRTEHHLVSRETHFPRMLSRRYFVLVEGILEDPDGGEVLSDVRDMKVVRVRHRRTVRCEFDLRPRSCPVDISIHWDGAPPRDALIAAEGLRGSPVEVGSGRVRIHLPKGAHTLVIGSGDRVLEHDVEVQSFQPTPVPIEIAGSERVVFRSCPPAVEPFLRGDLERAARALEREGQADAAHRVLARAALAEGRTDVAANHFHQAGRPRRAAELWERLGEPERAAQLWLEAGDPLQAAHMYRSAGNLVKAGEAYEAARDFDAAIECYKQAGEISRQVDALDRRGDTFAAATIALDNGWSARGIRLLRLVTPQSPHFAEACVLLADAFEREGHWDLAAQKLEEHINAVGSDGSSPDLQWRLAELLENAGHVERALSLLEELRRSEPTYPDVASRIEQLRKKRSNMQMSSLVVDSSRSSGSGDFAPPTMFLSDYRYEIIEEIGRGAMGVVFKARDRRLSRVVALKRLPDSLRNYPRAVQLFLREAQATARLNHPNIVTVFDSDQEDGSFFITMELLEGQALHQRLRELGRFALDEAVRIASQVAAGLEYAHGHGVVHRDVKTANLFLTREGVVKVMDFGLAKMLEEVRRAETGIGGTPFYMAPEQVSGADADARADLYALGATLFELLTGQVPFPDGDVTYHHRHTPAPDPRDRRPEIPGVLADLMGQLLAKTPDERPPSAQAVHERLEAIGRQLTESP